MNKLIKLWNSPYPQLYRRWQVLVIPSIIISLILYLLQPFGISQLECGRWAIPLGAACITFVASLIVTYLMPVLFPIYYNEQNWTLGKFVQNLIYLLTLIVIGLWAYLAWWIGITLSGELLISVLAYVLILAVFPIVFFLMWNHNLLLTRNLREITEMNLCLSEKTTSKLDIGVENASKGMLTFADGTKEVLEIEADNFLYSEAEGNYIHVVYRLDATGQVDRKLLRTTMKRAEEAIASYAPIVRCHRAFLVNVKHVVLVDGNSQGYRLKLDGCEEEVPVSRAYTKTVKALIESKI